MSKKTLVSEAQKPTEKEIKTPGVNLVASPGQALLTGGALTVDVDPSEFGGSPYVVFADTRSPAWPRISAAIRDAQSGDAVLMLPEPKLPIRLQPFRFMLLAASTYYAEVDNTGQIVGASRTKTATCDKQHVATVLLVFTPDGLVAASCTFKTTKAGAAVQAASALALAGKPEWATLSPAHKTTFATPQPWQRFVATVRMKPGTGRTSGMAYIAANAVIDPATVDVWQRVEAFMKDADRMTTLDAVARNHERRMEEISSMYGA